MVISTVDHLYYTDDETPLPYSLAFRWNDEYERSFDGAVCLIPAHTGSPHRHCSLGLG